MEISRQESWSGMSFPPPNDLPDPENWTHISYISWTGRQILYHWITWEAPHCAQFSSVTQSCPTLCDPMYHSMPGLPVHHQLPGSPKPISIKSVMPSSHPILCRPLLLLPCLSQHQGLFKWVSFSHQVAKVLEFQLQNQSFQWTPRTNFL